MNLSKNRGGISSGDREETGDLEARPSEVEHFNGDNELDDLTIHGASDPDLGLTDIGDVPADDWAANTGPSRSGEASSQAVDSELADSDRAPDGHTIELQPKRKTR